MLVCSMMDNKWLPFIQRIALLMALELCIAVVVSYYACLYLSTLYHFSMPQIAGLWGAISAVFILSPKREDVFASAKARFFGTLAGTAVPCVCAYIFGGYPLYSFAVSIFLTVILVGSLGIRDTYKVACITVCVVFVVGSMNQQGLAPWLNALSRLLESIVGMLVALTIDLLVYPVRRRLNLF